MVCNAILIQMRLIWMSAFEAGDGTDKALYANGEYESESATETETECESEWPSVKGMTAVVRQSQFLSVSGPAD